MISPVVFGLAALLASICATPCHALPMSLKCLLDQNVVPEWGAGFQLSIPFGEAFGIAQIDAENQRVVAMLHASDVLVGTFTTAVETAKIVWTQASSARAPLLGIIIRSDGHLLTIRVKTSAGASGRRAVSVSDTAADAVWSGSCSLAG